MNPYRARIVVSAPRLSPLLAALLASCAAAPTPVDPPSSDGIETVTSAASAPSPLTMMEFQLGVMGPAASLPKQPVTFSPQVSAPTITLNGLATSSGGSPIYFFRNEAGLSGELLTRVRVQGQASSLKPTVGGLMVRWSEHPAAGHFMAGVTSKGKVVVETVMPGRATRRWEAPMPKSESEIALRLRADGQSLQYFVSTLDGARRDIWIALGDPVFVTKGVTIGPYLDPGQGFSLGPQAVSATFTSFSVRELRELRKPSAPPAPLAKAAATPIVPGLPLDLFRGPLPGPNYKWPIGSGPTVPIPVPGPSPSLPFTTLRPGPLDVPLPVLDTCLGLPFVGKPCNRAPAQPELPVGAPSRLTDRLRTSYLATSNGQPFAGDPVANQLWARVGELKSRAILTYPASATVTERLRIASYNAETYLADVVHAKVSGQTRLYNPSQFAITSSFPFMEPVRQLRRAIEFCDDAVNLNWIEVIIFPIAISDAIDCKDAIKDATTALSNISKEMPDADKSLLNAAEYLQTLGLLSLVDPDFLAYTLTFTFRVPVTGVGTREVTVTVRPNEMLVTSLAGEVREWVDFVHDLYGDSNIPTKAHAGLATLDLAFRSGRGLHALQPFVDKNFTPNGGYGEGTSYLQYVNDQLLPLYAVAKIIDRLPGNLLPDRFVRSGKWLLDIADPSGLIPAIDDARAARDGYLAPYALLTNDNRFKEFVQGGRFDVRGLFCLGQGPGACAVGSIPAKEDGTNLAVAKLLSYPVDDAAGGGGLKFPGRVASEGIAKLTTLNGGNATSLTMITDSGQMLTAGGTHDQQDGLSVTLNRSRPVPSGTVVDSFIVDPGYGGFKEREKTSAFMHHNVPYLLDDGGVSANPFYTKQELVSLMVGKFPEVKELGRDNWWELNLGPEVLLIASMFNPALGPLAVAATPDPHVAKGAGGGSSTIVGSTENSFTARLDYDASPGDYALRTMFWDGGDQVIVDSIHSQRRNYGVRYALNPQTVASGSAFEASVDGGVTSTGGQSRFILNVSSQDGSTENKLLRDSSFPGGTPPKELVVENRGARQGSHSFFNYLSVAQALAPSDTAHSYEPCTDSNTAICLRHQVPEGTRMVFVNLRDDGRTWTMRLPSPAGASFDLFTDANFGVALFDARGRLRRARLFGVTKAYLYGGTSSVSFAEVQGEVALGPWMVAEALFKSAPVFDAAGYLAYYPTMAAAVGNSAAAAATHWVETGVEEGRTSSPVFDARYYLAQNPDLRNAFGPRNFRAGVSHWLTYGRAEGRASSPVFDPRYYVQRYPDLAAAFGSDYAAAAVHYLNYGIREGRQASSTFDPPRYLALHPDVAAHCQSNYACAVQHYLTYGRYEERRGTDPQALDGGSSHNACRGQGNYVCQERVSQYGYYYVNRPVCLRNTICGGLYYSCNDACADPNESDLGSRDMATLEPRYP